MTPCLAESSSRLCLTTFRVPLKEASTFYMEGIELFCGSFLQIPSWTWITPSSEVGIQVMFYCFIYVFFTCVFSLWKWLTCILHTHFSVCVCYSASVRCWTENKNRKCQKYFCFHICFNWERKVSLRDIERQQKADPNKFRSALFMNTCQQLSWLRPQLYINSFAKCRAVIGVSTVNRSILWFISIWTLRVALGDSIRHCNGIRNCEMRNIFSGSFKFSIISNTPTSLAIASQDECFKTSCKKEL